jgi:arginase family enzyme
MSREPRTSVVVFPFDAFGGAGCGQGAELMGDVVDEILADNDKETRPIRGHAYRDTVTLREVAFSTSKALNGWRTMGRQLLRQCLKNGERILWLGGNHLSVLPVYEELGSEGALGSTFVLQFDAHLDIQQHHDVNPHPANGNFLLHAEERLPTIVNVGHRDLLLYPKEIRSIYSEAYSALDWHTKSETIRTAIRNRARRAKRVWIDIDVDVFDPAAMPGVQAPLPFGLPPLSVLGLMEAAFAGNVIGVSISEFDPGRDRAEHGIQILGWLIEWLLLRWSEGNGDEDS